MAEALGSADRRAVSLLIVNYGTPDLVGRLLRSLEGHSDAAMIREAVVVDNGFPEKGDVRESLDLSGSPVPVEWVGNEGASYASGINQGALRATGEYLVVSNSDVEWLPDEGIAPLLGVLDREPTAGVVGPQLVFPDGSWQRSFGSVPSVSHAFLGVLGRELIANLLASRRHGRGGQMSSREVGYVDGAFMLIRRSCFDQLRGFDERFGFYCEDADFCFRAARAGWRSVFVPGSRMLHVRGASSTAVASRRYMRIQLEARRAFVETHNGPFSARAYSLLQLATAVEIAALYPLIAMAYSTERWKSRAVAARENLAATLGIGVTDRDHGGVP